jgi:hypothetical protein
VEPRSEIADAAEDANVGHGDAPGSLEIDREVARDLGLISTLDRIRAHFENDEPTRTVDGLDETLQAAAKATPVLNGDLCRLKAPRPGIYRVTIHLETSVADSGFWGLMRGNEIFWQTIMGSGRAPVMFVVDRLRFNGQQDLAIVALNGAASAAAIGQILATRIERIAQR